MKVNIIKKKKSDFVIPPNLPDYEKTYRTFIWNNAKNEIDWFSKDKLNIAYNAIDRHTEGKRKNKVALYWENDANNKK